MSRLVAGLALLASLAACRQDRTPAQQREAGNAGSIVLASQSIILPQETATLPASAEIVTTHCTACHSPELILTQPRLKPETWQAEVTKMRTAYKAAIDERDDAEIIAALVAVQRSGHQP